MDRPANPPTPEALTPEQRRALTAFLGQYVTENKRAKIRQVLAYRTYYVTIGLEDIYQPQNASATIRTCECLGVQTVHVIENRNEFRVSPKVTQGASKWVDIRRYRAPGQDNTARCIQELRERGYWIVATTPNATQCYTPEEIPLDRPLAFLFGNEEEGLSPRALEHADAYLRLPMYGFTQSYNISVSVAMTLTHVISRLHASDRPWRLTAEEQEALTLTWYRRIVRRHRELETYFWEQLQQPPNARRRENRG